MKLFKTEEYFIDKYNNFVINDNQNDFNIFVKQYEKWLVGTIESKDVNSDDANEIAQKVWIRIFNKKEPFQKEIDGKKTNVKNWLYRYLNGEIQHFYRDKQKKEKRFVNNTIVIEDEELDFLDNIKTEDFPNTKINLDHLSYILRKAINQLTDNFQDVIILHHYASKELKDIANITNTNYNTIRIWHDRAKKQLKDLLIKDNKQI